MKRPPVGLCIPTEIVKVVDGDTVKILFYGKVVTVRLQGYDAPETFRPRDENERRRGYEAKEYLERLLSDGQAYIWVEHSERLSDYLSINRLKTRLFVDELDVADAMKLAGHVK